MAEIKDFRVLRPVGPLESMSTARHALGFYFCIINTVAYKISEAQLVRSGGNFLQLIRAAVLQVAVLSQPMLRVGIIAEKTKSPQFVALSELDLQRIVVEEHEFASQRDMLRDMERSLTRPWPDLARRPGWKVKLFRIPDEHDSEPGLRKVAVSLAIHHALTDGLGTGLFHEDLLHALKHPDQEVLHLVEKSREGVVQLPAEIRLPPNQEQALSLTMSLSFLAGIAWDMLAPAALRAKKTEAWTGNPRDPNLKRAHMRILSLGSGTTANIIQACRKRKVTLTPLVNALCAASFARRVPADVAQAITSSTPINLRPFVRKDIEFDPRKMAVYVTAMDDYFGPEVLEKLRDDGTAEEEVWRLAAALRERLKRRMEALPGDDMVCLAGYVGDWNDRFRQDVSRPRKNLWEVSNIRSIGEGDGGDSDGWRMEGCLFAQSASVMGAALGVNVASVRGGELAVSFTWQDGILDDELVVGVRDDLKRWMTALGTRGKVSIV